MKKTYVLNTLLAGVVGIALLIAMGVRTVYPAAILPELLEIPNLVLLSLIALVAEHFTNPGAKRCYICIPVLSALTFGLLPWAAGFVAVGEIWKLTLTGAIVFTVTTWLFTSIQDRLSSGPAAKAAALMSAVGLYLAAQCFAGMI